MTVADYNTLEADLRTLLEGDVTGAHQVVAEALDSQMTFANMPFVNIRLVEHQPDVRAGQDYYGPVNFEIDIMAFDLSSHLEAAKIRNDLVRDVVSSVRGSPRFSGDVESTITTNVSFDAAPAQNGYLAAAIVEISVFVFEDR